MKKMIFAVLVFSGFLLTGCEDNKIYTIDEFMESKDLRIEYKEKCRNGELDIKARQNCQNLIKAGLKLNIPTNGSWK